MPSRWELGLHHILGVRRTQTVCGREKGHLFKAVTSPRQDNGVHVDVHALLTHRCPRNGIRGASLVIPAKLGTRRPGSGDRPPPHLRGQTGRVLRLSSRGHAHSSTRVQRDLPGRHCREVGDTLHGLGWTKGRCPPLRVTCQSSDQSEWTAQGE